MSGALNPSIRVKIANRVFTEVIRVTVTRDLQHIAGTFEVTLVDEARIRNALIAQIGQPTQAAPIEPGDPITLSIGDEPILIGWIEVPEFDWEGDKITARITGRDKTGDLVECAALPTGPAEFRGVGLLHVAKQVCAPYGITARADVDIGAPFERLSLHPHQTALTFLEGAARQRAVLLASDGIGGLLLTRGGATRGPAALEIGQNVHRVQVRYDWTHRFSDYFVKQDSARHRSSGPALDHTVVPLAGGTPPPAAPAARSAAEAPAIGTTGHATDPEVTRWRPTVRLTRSQSGMSSVQEQAEWAARVARGLSDQVHMTVLEWRAGRDNALWRPNQVVAVWDPYSGLDRDMLIAGVTCDFDEEGRRTRLRVVGVTAYDRINEAERRRHRRHDRAGHGPLDATPTPLRAQ